MPVDHLLPRRQEPVEPSTGVEPQHLPQHIRVAALTLAEPVDGRTSPPAAEKAGRRPPPRRPRPAPPIAPSPVRSSFSPASGSIPAVSTPPSGTTARGGTATGSTPGRRRQPGRARRGEQGPYIYPHPPHPQPLHQPHRQQRVPAEGEEVVVYADSGRPRTSANTVHSISSRTDAGPRPVTGLRGIVRGRQRGPVQLPVPRHRQLRQHDHCRRDHVLGQAGRRPFSHHPAQPIPVPARGGDVGGQPLIPRHVLPHDHHRLPHPRMPGQHGFDLAGLDTEPADLHLLIGPPDELQQPVPGPAAHIPGPVHPLPRRHRERARHEPLPGQPRPPQIPPRQPRPRHVQLPRHPRRHRPQPVIQHEHPRVTDGTTDVHAPAGAPAAPTSSRRPWSRSGRRR